MSSFRHFFLILALGISVLATPRLGFAADTCEAVFGVRAPNSDRPEPTRAFSVYDTEFKGREGWQEVLPPTVTLRLLSDPDTTLHARNFLNVIKIAGRTEGRKTAKTLWDALARNLQILGVSPSDAEARLAQLGKEVETGRVRAATIRQALGEMTIDQIQERTYGRLPLSPAPDSLLGEFLAKTGNASVVRRFPPDPRLENNGERRLMIAVDRNTFPLWKRMFQRENFLFHMHRPNQGTLEVVHEGKMGTYAQLENDFQFPEPQMINALVNGAYQAGASAPWMAPMILLSSTEGLRAHKFFQLNRSGQDWARHPWLLTNEEGQPYSATGGYECCTHWFGNIPVGDKAVKTYAFPGDKEGTAWERRTRSKVLTPYSRSEQYGNTSKFGRWNKLVHEVWQVPGRLQLADVLGLRAENLAAEFANPGWVLLTLAGTAPRARVPVVFVFVEDAKAELDPNSRLPVSAH